MPTSSWTASSTSEDSPTESARHALSPPAQFRHHVELPERLIRIYTYAGDCLARSWGRVDPGSGRAFSTGGSWVTTSTPPYVDIAGCACATKGPCTRHPRSSTRPPSRTRRRQRRLQAASREAGRAGARGGVAEETRLNDRRQEPAACAGPGVVLNFIATTRPKSSGTSDVFGLRSATRKRPGLAATDTVWKRRAQRTCGPEREGQSGVLTSHAPAPRDRGRDIAMRKVRRRRVRGAQMRTTEGTRKLRKYAAGGHT